MLNHLTIDFSELEAMLKKLSEMPSHVREEVDAEIEEAAREWRRLAVETLSRSTSQATGRLAAATNYRAGLGEGWEVFSQARYAAYNEWGTIEHVSVPAELQHIAIRFKGRGIRKRGGMKPKHYFFRHSKTVIPKAIKRIKEIIEEEFTRK